MIDGDEINASIYIPFFLKYPVDPHNLFGVILYSAKIRIVTACVNHMEFAKTDN
jgi:hypothetical protein